MRKNLVLIVKIVLLLGFVGGCFSCVVIQLIPYGRVHSNPPIISEPQWDSPKTREFFFRACSDCHSNNTVWPWYSNIAPVSWLVQWDVGRGRAVFNVSEWGQRRNESDEAVEAFQKRAMPPPIYVIMHRPASLSTFERQIFIQGLAATFGGERKKDDDD